MNRNDIFFELRNRGYGAEPSGVTSSSSSSSPLAGHFARLFMSQQMRLFFISSSGIRKNRCNSGTIKLKRLPNGRRNWPSLHSGTMKMDSYRGKEVNHMQSIFTKKLQLVSCQILNYLFRLGRISAAEKNETIGALQNAVRNKDGRTLEAIINRLEDLILDNDYFLSEIHKVKEENTWLA